MKVRIRAYLQELREGIRLLPEVIRLAFSEKYWADAIQRYADRLYTQRHFDEWEAWAEQAREDAQKARRE